MSDERIGAMVKIGPLANKMRQRTQERREWWNETREERVAEGVAKWGWSPDAECGNCGDTGRWPGGAHYCGCRAGQESQNLARISAKLHDAEQRWVMAEIPTRFADYRLSTAPNAKAAGIVRAWVDSERWKGGSNLLLHGPVGSGKTGLAVGALAEIHAMNGPQFRFWSVPMLLDRMRPGSDEDPMGAACRLPLIVLDDLGVEKASDWVRERLYVLVNARYEDRLPTIVTTNVNLAGLAESLGQRLVSRLAEDVEVVLVDGPDRRAR